MKLIVFRALIAIAVMGALVVLIVATRPTAPTTKTTESPGATPAFSEDIEEKINHLEVTDSCGPLFEGECLNVRSGPGSTFPALSQLRNGIVLAVATTTFTDEEGMEWYKVVFNEWIRYPSRVGKEWYVASEYVRGFTDVGAQEHETALSSFIHEAGETFGFTPPKKRILIDRSEQKLYAHEGEELFMETSISTGLDLTPTPRGVFTVYRKTPSRYMQGPLPGISDQYYDLPGVPWNLYFTNEGGAIHGAYWHEEFGKQWSHGCVNLPLDNARTLYEWTPLGTEVIVQD